MRHLYAAFVALVCLTLSLLVSAQTTSSSLTLVSTEWPPFTDGPGRPRFALDLVETALGRIGVTAKTRIVSPAEFTPSLTDGFASDGSAAAWKDAAREQVLRFSQAYLENRLVLVGRRGSDVSATSLANLAGKRIAIVEGYAYGDSIEQAGPVWVRAASEEDSLTRLLTGGVDYTLMDDLVVHYLVENYPQESGAMLHIGSTPLVTRSLYLAIRRSHPDAESIIQRFNAQLRGMIADHTYHRLLHVDWIAADLNGNGQVVYIPSDDRLGRTEPDPQRFYALFTDEPGMKTSANTPGFYVGGTIYADWASVPESYKDPDVSQRPDPRRSTASVFKFNW
jgi:polar amino acid transport system substrate-binding protein